MDPLTTLGIVLSIIGIAVLGGVLISVRADRRRQGRILDASEALPAHHLASVSDAVVVARAGGHVTYANRVAREWFGLDGGEPELWRLAQHAAPSEAFLELFAAEGQAAIELDGRTIRATSYCIGSEDAQQFVVVMSPVTPRSAPVPPSELPAAPSALRTLSDAIQAINSNLALESTLAATLEGARQLIAFDAGQICLWDVEQDLLIPRARSGPQSYINAESGRPYQLGEGFAGWMARERRALLVPDLRQMAKSRQQGPQWAERRSDPLVGSYVGVPLLADGELLGTLEIMAAAAGTFGHEQRGLLEVLAGQAARALANARDIGAQAARVEELAGLQRIAQAIAELKTPDQLYQRLGETIAELTGTQIVGVLLYDPEQERLIAQPPIHGLPGALTTLLQISVQRGTPARTVWEQHTSWYSNDLSAGIPAEGTQLAEVAERAHVHNVALAALAVGDRRIGALLIAGKGNRPPFSDDDLHRLESYAGQAAIVVESARLHAQTQSRAAELQGLQQIVRAMSALTDIDELYTQLTTRIAELMDVEVCGFLVYQPHTQRLDAVMPFYGLSEEVAAGYGLDVGQSGVARKLWQEHDGFISNRTLADPAVDQMGLREAVQAAGLRTIMLAPLSAGGRRFGMLQVSNRRSGNGFNEADQRLLSIFAGQAAALIDNARLYQGTRATLGQRATELRAVSRVNRELNTTIEVERILNAIATEARCANGADWANVVVFDWDDDHQEILTSITFGDDFDGLTRSLESVVASSSAPFAIDDFAIENLYRTPAKDVRSALLVPIDYDGQPIGAVGLYSRTPAGLGSGALEYALALASQATIAITNATRHIEHVDHAELLQRRAEQMAQIVELGRTFRSDRSLEGNLTAVAQAISESAGFRTVLIAALDETTGRLHVVTQAGLDAATAGRAALAGAEWEAIAGSMGAGRARLIPAGAAGELRAVLGLHPGASEAADDTHPPDAWHPGDLIAVRLLSLSGSDLGALFVDAPTNGLRPDRDAAELLEVLANQAAMIVENSRLYYSSEARAEQLSASLQDLAHSYARLDTQAPDQAMREDQQADDLPDVQANRLAALHRITREIATDQTPGDVLATFTEAITREMEVDQCLIALGDRDSTLTLAAAAGNHPSRETLKRLLLTSSPLRMAYETGEAVIYGQDETGSLPEAETARTLGVRAYVAVPFMAATARGVLLVASSRPGEQFREYEIDLFATLAGQIAAIYDNACLTQDQQALVHYREVIEGAIRQGLVIADAEGRIQAFNAVLGERYGWTNQMIGQPLEEAQPALAEAGLGGTFRRALAAGMPANQTSIRYPVAGEVRRVDLTIYPWLNGNGEADGESGGAVLLIDDVTERARLEADVAHRTQQLAALSEVSRTITSTLSIDDVVLSALASADDLVVFDHMELWLLDSEDAGRVILAGTRSTGSSARRETRPLAIEIATVPQFAQIARDHLPLIAGQRPPSFPGTPPDLATDHLRSWMGVPMVSGGAMSGIMVFEQREDRAFGPSDSQVAAAFANQVAVALENARLFEEAADRATALDRRSQRLALLNRISSTLGSSLDQNSILQGVIDQLTQALGCRQGCVYLFDFEEARGTLAFQSPSRMGGEVPGVTITLNDNPVIDYLLKQKQPLAVTDITAEPLVAAMRAELTSRDVQSTLIVPLIVGNALIGILTLDETDRQRTFDPDQIELAHTITNQAAIAVQNAQLFQETVSRQHELAVLTEAGQALTSSLDLGTVARQAADAYVRSLDVEGCAICIYDRTHDSLQGLAVNTRIAGAGAGSNLGLRTPLANYPSWQQAITGREPVSLSVRSKDITPAEAIWLNDHNVQRVLLMPLVVRDEAFGVVELWHTAPRRRFELRDIRLAQALTDTVATAIDNAHLHEDLEQRVEERTHELREEHDRIDTLYGIAVEMTASLDMDMVLGRALTLVGEAIGADGGELFLIDSHSSGLIHRATMNPAEALPPGGRRLALNRQDGLVGWVLRERKPVAFDEFDATKHNLSIPALADCQSLLAAPLVANNEVLGALFYTGHKPHAFHRQQFKLIEAAANQIAASITNAELYRLISNQASRLGMMLRSQQTEAAKSQAILESVADGVMVSDEMGSIIMFNAAAEEMLGLARHDVLGRPVAEMSDVYGESAEGWTEMIARWHSEADGATGKSFAHQIEIENRIIAVLVAPVRHGTEYLGTVSLFHDITREVMADRVKSEFVARVSHELRTPMTSIKGYADLLLMGAAGEVTDQQRHFVEVVRGNADRLTVLVNDLLDISRIEQDQATLDIQPIDLEAIIRNILEALQGRMAAEEHRLNIQLDLPEHIPALEADRDRLIQILTNLVNNAYQYTPEGGSLLVRLREADGGIQIDVEDTGIGISSDDQAHVFERFYRAEHQPLVFKTAGTGLGLSIVQQLVEMHGGRLWFESEEGVGSTFSVWLPATQS